MSSQLKTKQESVLKGGGLGIYREEADLAAMVFLCLLLAGSGYTDFKKGKVYNFWLLGGLAAGILCVGKDFFFPAMVVLTIGFFLFRLRMMGAGDGKLMALIVGYLGMNRGTAAIGAGFLVGAIWSLCRFWHQKSGLARLIYLRTYIMCIIQEKTWLHYNTFSQENKDQKERFFGEFLPHEIPLAFCLCVGVYLYLLGELAVRYKGGVG